MKNIWILSRGLGLYSTSRLVESIRRHEASLHVIDPITTSFCIHSDRQYGLWIDQQSLPQPDAVLARVGQSESEKTLKIMAFLEHHGIAVVNSYQSTQLSRDKFQHLSFLSHKGLATVPSVLISDSQIFDHLPPFLPLDGPFILKTLEGSQGIGVMRAHDLSEARALADTMRAMNRMLILQPYIKALWEGRVLVINQHVPGILKRWPAPNDFRSNTHRGGSSQFEAAPHEVAELARKACQHLKLHIAGVDLVMTSEGPLILEVNPSPGFEEFEKKSSINVANLIAEALMTTIAH